MYRKTAFTGAALLAGFFMASQAGAYAYRTCGGEKVVWDDPFAMTQNTFSIPAGSKREECLDNAIDRWRGVIGMDNMVSKSSIPNPLPIILFFDEQNDAAVTTAAEIGGRLGLTAIIRDACFWGGDMEYVEADVMVSSDADFEKVPENVLPSRSGRQTFLHEFGHAHGLLHDGRFFSYMRPSPPVPLVGGPGETVDPLPDDALGGRFLYPTPFFETNLFATAQRLQGSPNKILLNNEGTVSFCASSGGPLTVNSTVGNNGIFDLIPTERWWLSKSAQAYNGGIQIGLGSNTTYHANKVKTRQLTFFLPPLSAGTYFLYHGVDMPDEIDESREDDNAVREALVIKMNDC